MEEWINNPWTIAAVTVVVTLVASPALAGIARYVRSMRGAFTGSYVSITTRRYSDAVVIETVRCRHFGQQIRGRIRGVLFASRKEGELTSIAENRGIYRFSGRVDERLLVMSYYALVKGVKGSGTLTLQVNDTGDVFIGEQSEYQSSRYNGLRDQVSSSPCIWVKVDRRLQKPRYEDELVGVAKRVLRSWPSNSVEPHAMLIHGHFGSGKSAMAHAIIKSMLSEKEAE